MIKSFKDKETALIFTNQRSRRLPGDIQRQALRRLIAIDAAVTPEDLRNPPGNHFEALEGMDSYYSIRVNVQWRITFRWNDGAEDVSIEDYH